MDEEDLISKLEVECKNGLRVFCRKHNLNAGNVSKIINKKRNMIDSVASALGYKKRIIYERKQANKGQNNE